MCCGRGVCVQCWRERSLRPKRLCTVCYERRDLRKRTPVRLLHPPVSPRGRRYRDTRAAGAEPAERCTAPPRSPEKIREMAARVQAGQRLHRSDDAAIAD